MATTQQIREAWASDLCEGLGGPGLATAGTSVLGDPVRVNREILEACRALSVALRTNGYVSRQSVGGFNCRTIAGSDRASLHAYGLALDIDPGLNPFVRETSRDFSHTVFTADQVAAVEAIRLVDGQQVWRWGGDFGDYMHWQINTTRASLRTGILSRDGSSPMTTGGDDLYCAQGDGLGGAEPSQNVRHWQRKLVELGHDTGEVDGRYGDQTVDAVRAVWPDSDGLQIGGLESACIDIAIGRLGSSETPHTHSEFAPKGHTH